MYGFLYDQALCVAGKPYFVDKTPWYSLILPELALTYSEARFLILYRNPLAVFVSFVDTWFSIVWNWIDEFRPCILDFPHLLVQGNNLLGERGFVVSYEQLVQDPAPVVEGVCNWLGIEFRPEMLEYGNASLPVFPRGDPERVYQHVRPITDYVDAWQARLADPQMWRWINEYLDFLGPEVLKPMGYSYADLRSLVDSRRPARLSRASTISLDTLLSGRLRGLRTPGVVGDPLANGLLEVRHIWFGDGADAPCRPPKVWSEQPRYARITGERARGIVEG